MPFIHLLCPGRRAIGPSFHMSAADVEKACEVFKVGWTRVD